MLYAFVPKLVPCEVYHLHACCHLTGVPRADLSTGGLVESQTEILSPSLITGIEGKNRAKLFPPSVVYH